MQMWFKCQVDIGQFPSIIRLGPKCSPICIYMAERTSDTEHYLTEVEGNKGSQERDRAVDCGEEGEWWASSERNAAPDAWKDAQGSKQLFILIQCVCVSAHTCHGMHVEVNSLWELVFFLLPYGYWGLNSDCQLLSITPSILKLIYATKTSATSEMLTCYQFGCQFEIQPWPSL